MSYTQQEAIRLQWVWPCPCCGGSAARYPVNHASGCQLRAAVATLAQSEKKE